MNLDDQAEWDGGSDPQPLHDFEDRDSTAAIQPQRESRLSIWHLLIWTALCGVYLALARWIWLDRVEFGSSAFRGTYPAQIVLQSLGSGAALGFLPLWWSRLHAGQRFPSFPGEWLWMVLCLQNLAHLASNATIRLMNTPSHPHFQLIGIVITIGHVASLAFDVFALKKVKSPNRWRRYFWTRVLFRMAMCILSCATGWLGNTGYLVGHYSLAAIPAIYAIFIGLLDLRGREQDFTAETAPLPQRGDSPPLLMPEDHSLAAPLRYPWTHWVGLGVQAWGIATIAVAAAGVMLRAGG